ncbi:stage III sporulation protein AF [Mesobacillus harenae]|uniref:stage III sporulation protein AF n=1 Tax=Mesobacillus harenae TaxID=2213203 RepID=UPI001580F1C1|nr:stage III sporulation protein AF [Mesobacillus harenae]
MEFIKEWITNIIIFVLLATVIDMLLPNSSFQKYTKIVTGLLLIAIILNPVLKLLSSDFEETLASVTAFNGNNENNIENLIDLNKKEIQASNDAYILEQMAVHLEVDAEEELMEKHGLEIAAINLRVDESDQRSFPDNLENIFVTLSYPSKEDEAVEAVKKVDINTEQPLPSKRNSKDADIVASLLSEKWNVPLESIQVEIEGGRETKNEQ